MKAANHSWARCALLLGILVFAVGGLAGCETRPNPAPPAGAMGVSEFLDELKGLREGDRRKVEGWAVLGVIQLRTGDEVWWRICDLKRVERCLSFKSPSSGPNTLVFDNPNWYLTDARGEKHRLGSMIRARVITVVRVGARGEVPGLWCEELYLAEGP